MLDDFRFALRTLAKSPAFALTAALTLALGIGANTAIFTVVNAELLRPLPYRQPERLVRIFERNGKLKLEQFTASVLNYVSWKERARSFEAMGAVGFLPLTLTGNGQPEMLSAATLSPSVLPLLGIEPALGHGFRPGDDAPGAPAVVMLSRGLWQRRFGAEAALIGKSIQLNGAPYTVIGIAPAALDIIAPNTDLWAPLTIDPAKEFRLNHTIYAIGRLKPGVSIAQAQTEMVEIARQVGAAYPEVKDWSISLLGFNRWLVADDLRTALLVLLGAVALVLLIACANVANLLLSRAVSRQTEMAVRAALGAGRWRVMRQLLTESLVLSLAGGAAGALLAVWAVRAIEASLPPGLLPVANLNVDSQTLLFALGLMIATSILFGLAPAWQMARSDLNTVLKQGGRGSAGARPWLRDALVGAEMALATVLLTGAGLLLQSLAHLKQAPLGFRPERLLTFQVDLPAAKYGPVQKSWAFDQAFLSAVRATPGVLGAGMSSAIPFGVGIYSHTPFTPVGKSILPPGMALPADWRSVSPGFFATMRIPLLRGRDFSQQDTPLGPIHIVVSQSMARKIWGEEDPIGRVLTNPSKKNFYVVGVVGDVRGTALNAAPEPTLYYCVTERQWQLSDVVVRTAGDPDSLVGTIRRELQRIDADVPMANIKTMDDWIANSAAQPRLNTTLLAVFAGMALLIAAIGIYGVLSYSVTQRTREIGLRMALGAQPGDVLGLVVRQGMAVAAIGIAAGVAGALAFSRVLASLLFGVEPRDPATLAAAAVSLAAIALAACAIPARRAASVDPMSALRQE